MCAPVPAEQSNRNFKSLINLKRPRQKCKKTSFSQIYLNLS